MSRIGKRRRFLKSVGAVVVGGSIAGCTGGSDGGDGGGGGSTTTSQPTTTAGGGSTTTTEMSAEEQRQAWREMAAEEAASELEGDETLKFWTQQSSEEFTNKLTQDANFEGVYEVLDGNVEGIQGAKDTMIQRYIRGVASSGTQDMEVFNMSFGELVNAGIKLGDMSEIPGYQQIDDHLKYEGVLGPLALRALGLGYNTELVSPPPSGWSDLTSERFAGKKITIDFTPSADTAAAFLAWKPDKWGEEYVRAIGEQDPIMIRSSFKTTLDTSNGDAWAAFPSVLNHVYRFSSGGAPIDFVRDPEEVIWTLSSLGMAHNPKHPWAAKLYIDWVMTHPEQQTAGLAGYMSTDTSVANPPDLLDTYNGEALIAPEVTDDPAAVRKRFQELIGAPSI